MTDKERYEKQIRPELKEALTKGIIYGDMFHYLKSFKDEYIGEEAATEVKICGGAIDIKFTRITAEIFEFSFSILQ